MPGKVSKKARLKHIKEDTKTGCKISVISGSLLFTSRASESNFLFSVSEISGNEHV